jgi:hypothetical protein
MGFVLPVFRNFKEKGMKSILFFTMIMSLGTPSIYAQTTFKEAKEMHPKKKAEKNVKTNGEISTSGCETASGKNLSENDFGYEDCIKQIGTKKKNL